MKKARVIGGGIMGLGVARELAGAGFQVELFERNARLGDEASRASAGMIGPQSEALQDDAYFAATLASRDMWPSYSESLQTESGVDIGFRSQGALHLAFGAGSERRLEAKYLWQKKKAGKVERLEGEALSRLAPGLHPRVSCAFLAHGDYMVDNEALVDALAASCLKRGVAIRLNAEAPVQDRDPSTATIIASGAWAGSQHPGLKSIHPVKGQMLSFKAPKLMPSLPLHAEFCYLVPRGERLLVGATVETVGFDKRMTGEGVEWLLQNAFETMPDLRNCEVDRLWAGLRPGNGGGWPVLGALPEPGLYAAAGHYRRGVLFLPLSAKALLHSVTVGGLPPEAEAFAFKPAMHGV